MSMEETTAVEGLVPRGGRGGEDQGAARRGGGGAATLGATTVVIAEEDDNRRRRTTDKKNDDRTKKEKKSATGCAILDDLETTRGTTTGGCSILDDLNALERGERRHATRKQQVVGTPAASTRIDLSNTVPSSDHTNTSTSNKPVLASMSSKTYSNSSAYTFNGVEISKDLKNLEDRMSKVSKIDSLIELALVGGPRAAASSSSRTNEDAEESEERSDEDDDAARAAAALAPLPSASSSSACLRTVYAPPGKLGLVVCSSCLGPMVQLIRPDSILVGSVELGAVIVEVDGVTCRNLKAGEVTRMMAKRQGHKRKIVFEKQKFGMLSEGVLKEAREGRY